MIITSLEIHNLGFKYNWINKHFRHLSLDYCFIKGHAQYTVFNVFDLVSYAGRYVNHCKNPEQREKSNNLMKKLIRGLYEYNSARNRNDEVINDSPATVQA